MKSSTVLIWDHEEKSIGVLCINYDFVKLRNLFILKQMRQQQKVFFSTVQDLLFQNFIIRTLAELTKAESQPVREVA